jgi:hypothetical protein
MRLCHNYRIELFCQILKRGSIPTFRLIAKVKKNKSRFTELVVDVSCSRGLLALWRHKEPVLKNEEDLRRVIYEFSRIYLEDKLKSGNTTGYHKVHLKITNSPKTCPFDSTKIKIDYNKLFKIEVNGQPTKLYNFNK